MWQRWGDRACPLGLREVWEHTAREVSSSNELSRYATSVTQDIVDKLGADTVQAIQLDVLEISMRPLLKASTKSWMSARDRPAAEGHQLQAIQLLALDDPYEVLDEATAEG